MMMLLLLFFLILQMLCKSEPWQKCPYYVEDSKAYSINKENRNIITKVSDGYPCTAIGKTPLPPNKTSLWYIKIHKTRNNDCYGIYVGVAPIDIDQSSEWNYMNCGWYFNCNCSTLWSGPPHNYAGCPSTRSAQQKRRKDLHAGSVIGVAMDTQKGELSLVLDGADFGTVYSEIPLDEPLVPCVIISTKDDSVELSFEPILPPKEKDDNYEVDKSLNLHVDSRGLDSVTMAWDPVTNVKFYQIEVDGAKVRDRSSVNKFTKKGFLPGTEHTFRVRAVCNDRVKLWSKELKAKTHEAPLFSECTWKEATRSYNFIGTKKYALGKKNPRIAMKTGWDEWTMVLGTSPLPPGEKTAWGVKALSTKYNNGAFYVGVVPFDVDQNTDTPYKFGWYIYCHNLTLCSGPPHNYYYRKYVPMKERGGGMRMPAAAGDNDEEKYVRTGESVGVAVDTAKGNISFVVHNVNYGVAYRKVPLDRPLVPCALLYYKDDAVGLELDTPGTRENVSRYTSVPRSLTVTDNTWNTLTVSWAESRDASMYQVKVDDVICQMTKNNSVMIGGLHPRKSHTIAVRNVYEASGTVSEWSSPVEGITCPAPFSQCAWAKCPERIHDNSIKYIVSGRNNRVATCTNADGVRTVVSDSFVPARMTVKWGVRIRASRDNDGKGMWIGVAQSDIDQSETTNYVTAGWYFYCLDSSLWSGPPHNYKWRSYGPRLGEGKYVNIDDTVGVTMDTLKGELSFAVNGRDFGLAYCGVPLDKPLLAAAIFYYQEDSVELII